MYKNIKYNKILRILLLVAIFAYLTVDITKNIVKIYTATSMQQTMYLPIIMYHQVKNNKFGKDVISPYEFESDLKYLEKNNYNTITMTQLIDYVYNDKELPNNPIILSFDDGYLSTYKYVFPMLKKYNMNIVLSVVGKVTDDFSKVFDDNMDYSHITWEQINEMESSGLVEIQNHTYNLHKICKGRYGCSQMTSESLPNYEKLLAEDLMTLQDKIQLMTGKTPNTFTYPYGKYNHNTEDIVKELGFKATLSCEYGINRISKDPEKLFGLKRISRSHNQSIEKLIKEVRKTIRSMD